jgi:hypothetical protein
MVATMVVAAGFATGCSRCDRDGVARAQDDAALPVDTAVDAQWRDQNTIGFGRDILPLFYRDCPKGAPPYNDKTGIGIEEGPRRWYCNAEIRPGVRRYIDIGIEPMWDDRVTSYALGYEWDEGQPQPPECVELYEREMYEWIGAVVKNQDGVPLTGTDREFIRRYWRNPSGGAVLLSTGPLRISGSGGNSCVMGVGADVHGLSWDPHP